MAEDRTVIVTGASEGLGASLVGTFAEAGWTVIAAARSASKLQAVAQNLAGGAGRVVPVPTDVANCEQVIDMVSRAQAETGRIDVLINNAGIDTPGPIEELDYADWDRIIAVNLSGAFYCTKAVYPVMRAQGSGFVVNIASVAGLRGAPNAAAYCASKFGMAGFTQALQAEAKTHNIRASVVYPGGMDTGWTGQKQPEFLKPDDVAVFVRNLVTQPPGLIVNEAVISPIVEPFYP